MKTKHYLLFFVAVLSLLLPFSSCKWGAKRKAPQGRNIICVVDFSDATNAAERLAFYQQVIKNTVIAKMGLHDRLSIVAADRATLTNASDIFFADLGTKNFVPEQASPTEEDELTNANLARYKDTLGLQFDEAFRQAILNRNKTSHGTDIFGALEIVKDKLKAADNHLILLSDMMNWSSALKMEPGDQPFTSNPVELSVKKAPAYELPNCDVLVLTAAQNDITAEHFKLVQAFWVAYFNMHHIKLLDYNSGSAAKLDELMTTAVTEAQ